jgi:hypothetical protein
MSDHAAGPGTDPTRDYRGLGRDELALLVREYLLAGHMIDRAGMPHVIGDYGAETMQAVAIDEWMGASPIYTRRMQRVLGYVGDDVATMFKGIQLDVGSPPQFMDFRFAVESPRQGEFWLDSCGALLDVEPMGDEFVVAMCHDIEDPTFDATACAVNPRARVRPIHRPPRQPVDRHPHCHWTVTIDPDEEPVPEPIPAVRIGASLAAGLPLAAVDPDDTDGRSDYRGPLLEDLELEQFSRSALTAIADEVCLQGHLLTMSFLAAIESRKGVDAAIDIGRRQFIGVAGLTAERLHRAFGLGSDLASMATVLELHPAFRPRSYVDLRVAEGDRVTIHLGASPARSEPREHPWPTLLDADHHAALDAIVAAVDRRAACVPIEPERDGELAFAVEIGDEPTKEAPEVALTKFSTGAGFEFEARPGDVPVTLRPRDSA